MSLDLFLGIYAGLLGLVVGSYLNVVIHRLPRHQPTVVERSRCPHCGKAIRPWHNIPLIGYLILGGRCYDCRKTIHWRYPVVEGLVGILFFLCYRNWHASLAALAAAALCALLVALATIDLEHFMLPDRLTLPGIVLGLLLQPWLPWTSLPAAFAGVMLGAGLVLLAGGTWRILYGRWGMGFGDAKLLAMIGAFLGWQGVLVALALGSLLGALTAAVGALAGRITWGSRLPFGAFLAAGALAALFGATTWLDAYLGLATP